MTENMLWVIVGVAAVLLGPVFVFGLNERRLRRRHRALAGRRKPKMRL